MPFAFGQAIKASIIIQIWSAKVEQPIATSSQFPVFKKEFSPTKTFKDMAIPGRVSMKTIGMAMNHTGRFRRHNQNVMTRKARPAKS